MLTGIRVDTGESLTTLAEIKLELRKGREVEVRRRLAHVKSVASQWFLRGTRGFRPRPGGALRTGGLRESVLRTKRGRTFVVLWHPLANLYHNFQRRRRVRWLDIINRLARRTS